MIQQMTGHLTNPMTGQILMRGGFQAGGVPTEGIVPGPSVPLFTRGMATEDNETVRNLLEAKGKIERGEMAGDNIGQLYAQIVPMLAELQRGITSGTSYLPIRENLEAPARLLVPRDTPLRNMIPRIPGSGTSSAWRQIVSLGGGYALTSTTITSGTSSATQTVGSTSGWNAGDNVYIGGATGAQATVQSVTNSTTVVFTSSVSTTTADIVTNTSLINQGGTDAIGAVRTFFQEAGAPASHTTQYASKSASYKLLGTFGSVTVFAMAAGANFQPQYSTEKSHSLFNLMLNEENALTNGSSTSTAPPWGDGTTAMGFDGLTNLIATANGCPSAQVQTSVGALTMDHIDSQLARLFYQGGQNYWILANGQEILSLTKIAQAAGSIIRMDATADAEAILGMHVGTYKHPITGDLVPIMPSRFLPPGTLLFGSKNLPDGSPALDISVLPQVELPQLAPNESVQGYVAQELAPTTAAPQVLPFIVSVFEVPRMKAATVFAKSTGVTSA